MTARKIVITVDSYAPKTNGIQRVTQYQAEGLSTRGYDVVVVTSDVKGAPSEEKINGVTVRRVNAHMWHMWHRGDRKGFQETVVSACADADLVINVSAQSFAAAWLFPVFDMLRCPKMLIMHGMHDFAWKKTDFRSPKAFVMKVVRNIRWSEFYHRNLPSLRKYNLVTHLHGQDGSFRWFEGKGIGQNRVVMNAAQDGFFADEVAFDEKRGLISVGTYCAGKNQKMILKAYYRSGIDSPLALIGPSKNAYFHKLVRFNQKLQRKYGTRDVSILAGLPRAETISRIKSAAVYVCSSRQEFFPVSVVEAMAAGTVWISTNVGVVKHLPGGVVVNGVKEMAERFEELSRCLNDRLILAEEGRAYASKNLSEGVAVDVLCRCVNETCEKRKGSA